jgi:hypothetical protein
LFSTRAIRGWRSLLIAAAALPLLQTTGCFPDPIGALNFELQSLVNNALITAASTIINNLLGI